MFLWTTFELAKVVAVFSYQILPRKLKEAGGLYWNEVGDCKVRKPWSVLESKDLSIWWME